jgi:hypothetical protein
VDFISFPRRHVAEDIEVKWCLALLGLCVTVQYALLMDCFGCTGDCWNGSE